MLLKKAFPAFVLSLLAVCPAMGQQGTKRALLVGINLYQPAGTVAQHPAGCTAGRCSAPTFKNLNGSLNDVEVMRDLLNTRFGFDPKNITVLTNPALPASGLPYQTLPAEATAHEALLAAMRKYLVDEPKAGDTVVFYYAGHGSLRVNSKGTKLSMMVNGRPSHVDSTLVPADAWTGKHDILDREITAIFNAALDKKIKLTVIMDSCHSGSITRGVELGKPMTARSLEFDPDDIGLEHVKQANGEDATAPSQRTDNPALIFSAAEQDESANETMFGAQNGPGIEHGAFTVALVRTLMTLPTDAPASTVYRQVRAAMEGEHIPNQAPQMDASDARLNQPIFGGISSDSGGVRAGVIGVDDHGGVLLDAGRLSGIGVGSEFTWSDNTAQKITLKVTDLDGITHAKASVESPAGAKVKLGQVFTLSKWAPNKPDALHFWTWPATLSDGELMDAMAQVKMAGYAPVEDPVEMPWTDMLDWNGSAWEIRHAGQPAIHLLGKPLRAADIKKNLAPGALLWVNLPLSPAIAEKLTLHAQNSLIAGVEQPGQADYILVGSVVGGQPKWAWFHKQEFDAGPHTVQTHDHTAGCSTQSSFPLSSDWVGVDGIAPKNAAPMTASEALNNYAGRLAKINGWMNLVHDENASMDSYYQLVFKHAEDKSVIDTTKPVVEGTRLNLFLSTQDRVSEQRWVYVLDIDCQGKGRLIYPRQTTDNQFPNMADMPRDFQLPGSITMHVGPPFGMDTVLFITTEEPLPDAASLNFEGVGTRTTRGESTPLSVLLSDTSAGTAAELPEIPTSWNVTAIPLVSVPSETQTH